MMWDEVMERIKTLVLADATLSGLFGTHFRRAAVGDMQIPGIEWSLLGDTEGELWDPMLVQFDIWTAKAQDARTAERRLRSLLATRRTLRLDDITLITAYNDGADLAIPNRANYTGRALRFRLSPMRQQYALPRVD